MKTRFYLSLIGLLLGSLFVTSCDNEDAESTRRIPTVEFNIDTNGYIVANGETFVIKELSIDKTKSSQGIYIKQVEYYFDGGKISTSTSAPFGLNYQIKNKSIGKHEFKIKIKVIGDGYAEMDYTLTTTVTVMEQPLTLDINFNYDNEQYRNGEIRNGEVLSGIIDISENTTFDAKITKIEYYWDGLIVGSANTEPFKFSYKIDNESLGTHEFKVLVYVSSPTLGITMTAPIIEQFTVIQ